MMTPFVFLRVVIILHWSSVLVDGNEGEAEQCYPCNKLNRMWEFAACTNKFRDCGDCYLGYKPSSNASQCWPAQLNNVIMGDDGDVTTPTNNHYPRGSTIKLICPGDDIYECSWKRNLLPVEIAGRYLQDRKLQNECSLEITDFREEDTGEWTCEVFTTPGPLARTNVRRSWLHFEESNLLYAREGETWAVPVGQSVVLACYFHLEVDCSWTRWGNNVEIQPGKYSYAYKPTNGLKTTDCSLRIHNFREADDVGKWKCHGFGVSSHNDIRKSYMELVAPDVACFSEDGHHQGISEVQEASVLSDEDTAEVVPEEKCSTKEAFEAIYKLKIFLLGDEENKKILRQVERTVERKVVQSKLKFQFQSKIDLFFKVNAHTT